MLCNIFGFRYFYAVFSIMVEHCVFMNFLGVACIPLLFFIFLPFSTFIFRHNEGRNEICLRDSTDSKTPFTPASEQHGYSVIESSFRKMKLSANGTCCTSFYSVPQDSGVRKKEKYRSYR